MRSSAPCGMLVGGALYALSFDWVKANILPVGAMGKVQLPQFLGIGAPVLFAVLAIVAILMFVAHRTVRPPGAVVLSLPSR